VPSGPRPDPPTRSVRLAYAGTYGTAPWANILWCRATGTGEISQDTLNDFVDAAADAFSDNMLANLSTLLTLTSISAILYSSDDENLHGTASASLGGSVSGNPMPAQVSIGITWSIAVSYRGGHPRTYLCGVPYAAMDGLTTISSSVAGAIASDAAAWHTDLEAFSGTNWTATEHGVMSFVRDDAWRTPPVFYRITGARVDARLDTQRRRLGRDLP
jgi:hypothetical protein